MNVIIKRTKLNNSYNFNCSGYGSKSGCDTYCKGKCYYCPCVGNFA